MLQWHQTKFGQVEMDKDKIKKSIKSVVSFIANPRLLLCFGLGWMITNGWSYVMLGLGTFFGINWMIAVSSAYLALLWIPFTPEKIITFTIAIALLRMLFPKDEKTLGTLRNFYAKSKQQYKDWRDNRKNKSSRS